MNVGSWVPGDGEGVRGTAKGTGFLFGVMECERRVQMTEVPALPSHHLLSPGRGLHSHQLLHGEEVGLKLQPPTFPEALEPSAVGGPHLSGIPRPSDCGEGC